MAKFLIVVLIVTVLGCVSAQRGSPGKPGKCPDTSGIITTCEIRPDSCYSDNECSGNMKCCSYGCNRICMQAEGSVTPITKPGTCPPATGVGLCADTCENDSSCSGQQKCCRNGCGALACSNPASALNRLVKKPGSCPPSTIRCIRSVCQSDGDCLGNKKCCSGNCLCSTPMFGGK